jgi:hypothetical protein
LLEDFKVRTVLREANGVWILQDAMLINTADGMAATALAGEPATIQFVSPRSTSVTFEAIREHMCASLFPPPHHSSFSPSPGPRLASFLTRHHPSEGA